MTMPSDRIERMRELTRAAHAGQTRNGGRLPYWVHPDGVAGLCREALARSGELPADAAEDVVLAAHGHDLYEDTAVTPEQVSAEFGHRVAGWIAGMTNRRGDHDLDEYLRSFAAADDEVRLIKYADLADNTLSVAYGLHDVGLDWATGFFLPIAERTRDALAGVPFTRLRRSGVELAELAGWARVRLLGALESASGQPWAVTGRTTPSPRA